MLDCVEPMTRSTFEEFHRIMIDAQDKRLILKSSNNELWVEAGMDIDGDFSPFRIAVPARAFIDAVKSFRYVDCVDMGVKDGRLVLHGDNSTLTTPTYPDSLMTESPAKPLTDEIVMEPTDLAQLVHRVDAYTGGVDAVSSSKEPCIAFAVIKGKVKALNANTSRLTVDSAPCQYVSKEFSRFIGSVTKSAAEAMSKLPVKNGKAILSMSRNLFFLTTTDFRLVGRLVDGNPDKVKSILTDKSYACKFVTNASYLRTKVAMMASACGEALTTKSPGIEITIQPNADHVKVRSLWTANEFFFDLPSIVETKKEVKLVVRAEFLRKLTSHMAEGESVFTIPEKENCLRLERGDFIHIIAAMSSI